MEDRTHIKILPLNLLAIWSFIFLFFSAQPTLCTP